MHFRIKIPIEAETRLKRDQTRPRRSFQHLQSLHSAEECTLERIDRDAFSSTIMHLNLNLKLRLSQDHTE